MAKETIDVSSLPEGEAEHLSAVLTELQGLTFTVIAGGSAAAELALAGIATADTLLAVIRFDVAADTGTSATGNKVQAVTNLIAEASISSAGHVELASTDTTGDTLLVVWLNKS